MSARSNRRYFFIATLLLALACMRAHAASFDCKKAKSETEKAICSSEVLSKIDEEMEQTYRDTLARVANKAYIRRFQRRWLQDDVARCNADLGCLLSVYEDQLTQLHYWADKQEKETAQYHGPGYRLYTGGGNGIGPAFQRLLDANAKSLPFPCELTVPGDIPGMEKPVWKAMEVADNGDLYRQLYVDSWATKQTEENKREMDQHFKGVIQESRRGTHFNNTAEVDVFNRGTKEHVLRITTQLCKPNATSSQYSASYYLYDPATRKIDLERSSLLRFWGGKDLVLYKGQAYFVSFGNDRVLAGDEDFLSTPPRPAKQKMRFHRSEVIKLEAFMPSGGKAISAKYSEEAAFHYHPGTIEPNYGSDKKK